jgi:hypothetical protein
MEISLIPEQISDMNEKKFPSAVVYVLQCIDNYYYIGSTINHPRYRLNNHKKDSIAFPDRHVYKHINSIGWENVHLDIVEEYPCDTKEELHKREDECIKQSLNDMYCLNYNRACVSKEEHRENMTNYYLANREKIIEQHREYIKTNKEKVEAYHANYRIENAAERAEYSRQYAAENPEAVKATKKAYYEEHKEEIVEKQKAYVEANKDAVKLRKKEWTEKNKEHLVEVRKKYAEENKEVIQERGKEYYEKNKDVIKEKLKAYRDTNKEKAKEYMKAYREQNREKLSESHTCDCGGKYTKNHEDVHKASKRHLKFLASTSAAAAPHKSP